MTDAFAKHGIRHLSPSALALWRNDPALYVGRYLLKWQDSVGPAAWLGNAVEIGVASWLYKRDIAQAKAAAEMEWLNKSQGDVSDDVEVTHARLPAMLAMAIQAFGDRLVPTSTQARVECWLHGIPVPIIGYTDFEWAEDIVDLKTTKAVPSTPRADHLIQMAVYWRARSHDKACRLIYVTEKKSAVYLVEPDEMEVALVELETTARTLERFLSRVRDGRDAITLLPADTTGFRWTDDLRTQLNAERMAA